MLRLAQGDPTLTGIAFGVVYSCTPLSATSWLKICYVEKIKSFSMRVDFLYTSMANWLADDGVDAVFGDQFVTT